MIGTSKKTQGKQMTTTIYNDHGTLVFSPSCDAPLASRQDYESADRCVGSVFESLTLEEKIELSEGVFALDEDLDLVKI